MKKFIVLLICTTLLSGCRSTHPEISESPVIFAGITEKDIKDDIQECLDDIGIDTNSIISTSHDENLFDSYWLTVSVPDGFMKASTDYIDLYMFNKTSYKTMIFFSMLEVPVEDVVESTLNNHQVIAFKSKLFEKYTNEQAMSILGLSPDSHISVVKNTDEQFIIKFVDIISDEFNGMAYAIWDIKRPAHLFGVTMSIPTDDTQLTTMLDDWIQTIQIKGPN